MKQIPLTRNQFAIVDDEDFEWLSQWRWRAQWDPDTRSYYAVRSERKDSAVRSYWCIGMHRQILELKPGDPRQADHIESGQTLDNRRSNLRISTRSQNQANRRQRNKTGFKGVRRNWKKWTAVIALNGKRVCLGTFPTPELAHAAYCSAAKQHHGEFARSA